MPRHVSDPARPSRRRHEAQRHQHRRLLGAHLRQLREKAGFTEASLARRAGYSQQYIARIEQGLVNLPIETLVRLAHALHVSLTTIVIALDHHSFLSSLSKMSSLD